MISLFVPVYLSLALGSCNQFLSPTREKHHLFCSMQTLRVVATPSLYSKVKTVVLMRGYE